MKMVWASVTRLFSTGTSAIFMAAKGAEVALPSYQAGRAEFVLFKPCGSFWENTKPQCFPNRETLRYRSAAAGSRDGPRATFLASASVECLARRQHGQTVFGFEPRGPAWLSRTRRRGRPRARAAQPRRRVAQAWLSDVDDLGRRRLGAGRARFARAAAAQDH